jgi:hypothetical protein
MDLGSVALAIVAFVLGGLFNGIVGVATGEYRARQDQKRLDRRERSDRLRDYWLEEARRTRGMMSADILRLAAQAAGDQGLEEALPSDPAGRGPTYELLGDVSIAQAFFELETRLFYRKPGSGLSEDDLHAWVVTMARVGEAFDEQERLIMNDEEPRRIAPEVLASVTTWRSDFPRSQSGGSGLENG